MKNKVDCRRGSPHMLVVINHCLTALEVVFLYPILCVIPSALLLCIRKRCQRRNHRTSKGDEGGTRTMRARATQRRPNGCSQLQLSPTHGYGRRCVPGIEWAHWLPPRVTTSTLRPNRCSTASRSMAGGVQRSIVVHILC